MPRPDPLPRRGKRPRTVGSIALYRGELLTIRPRRKPPEAGIAVPAVPPKGPLPKQGGAEAPLTFD